MLKFASISRGKNMSCYDKQLLQALKKSYLVHRKRLRYTKRLFAESWLISKSSNVINRNDGNTRIQKKYCNLQFLQLQVFLQLHSIIFIFPIVLLLCKYACCFLRRNIHNHCAIHNYAIFLILNRFHST